MFKQFLIYVAISGSLMAAATVADVVTIPGVADQPGFARFNCPPTIPGAFTMRFENASAFVASLSENSDARIFLAPFNPAEHALSTHFTAIFRKSFLAAMSEEVGDARSALFNLYDSVLNPEYRPNIPLLMSEVDINQRVTQTIRSKLDGKTNPDFIQAVCDSAIGGMASVLSGQVVDVEFTAQQQHQLQLAKLSQIIAQAYFRETGEGYVEPLPFVKGFEGEIIEAAISSGFLIVHQPLENYNTYQHLASAVSGKETLVLCCGRFSLNVNPYESVPYKPLTSFFVSSGHHCNHDNHVTLARTPGIYPDIVADTNNPVLLDALSNLQPTFTTIVDEEGAITSENRAVLEGLLKNGGIIVSGNRYEGTKVIFTKP